MQSVKKNLSSSLVHSQRSGASNPRSVKTQVVCTIGPASNNVNTLKKMLEEGMGVARMNFSHGDYEWHESVVKNVRQASEESGYTCAIMLDTKGPEIRTGKLEGHTKVLLTAGQTFTFYTDEALVGNQEKVGVTYKNLIKTVKIGSQILVSDGLISFTVTEINEVEGKVVTRVDNSGILGETKGVNLPGLEIDLPAVTEKDIRDIEFGVKHNVDMIAASFIRTADNVRTIRNLPGVQENQIMIISKIESQEGLDNFNSILQESDGIMVARGDLGVEIPIEKVATAQKMMISKCNAVGKPVITATQMLESMTENPRPTRAEATDVANAVFDGSDCVMLSAETASGKYPVVTVKMMDTICRQAEKDIDYRSLYKNLRVNVLPPTTIPHSIASSAVKTQWDIEATLIVCLTDTGNTARLVSRYRPSCPILVITSSPRVARQILISRGCVPFLVENMKGTEDLIQRAISWAKSIGLISGNDKVVITSGILEATSGSTNMLKVDIVQ
jgi:pyruvate kinase